MVNWKKIAIIFTIFSLMMIFVACDGIGFGAIDNDDEVNNSEIDFSIVYAYAEEAGYTGTMEELIALFKGDSAYDLAKKAGFSGTEEEWLASLVGATGKNGSDGKDGLTPSIGENGHWIIGDIDTGVTATGSDGNGIDYIEKNEEKCTDEYDFYDVYFTNGTGTDFQLARGKDGKEGKTGNGIRCVDKVLTEGLVDTYVITFTDDTEFTFYITNGNGIAKIEKTNSSGLADTYTIYYTNGTTFNYTVLNGEQGVQGVKGETGNGISSLVKTSSDCHKDLYTVTFTDGSSAEIEIDNNGSGHVYGEWITIIESTCSLCGIKVRICSLCGESDFAVITSEGHEWSDWLVSTEATCTEFGEEERICSVCGEKESREIEPIGHIDENSDNVCDRCEERLYIDDPSIWGTEGIQYTLKKDDTYEVSGYQGNDTEIHIPATYLGKDITSIGERAFQDMESISVVTIGSNVQKILLYAFSGCSDLTSVTIPSGVKTIDTGAFLRCISLASITLPASTTSLGIEVFGFCSGLESIIVEEGNEWFRSEGNCLINGTTLVEGCNQSVIPTDGSVTTIDTYAFYGRDNLTSITIPDSITNIWGYAFCGCKKLSSIFIPRSVKQIGANVFSYCDSLESILIDEENAVYCAKGNCIIEKATNTLIRGCNASVIPDDNSVMRIGRYAFSECSLLTSISIPSSVTVIDEYAFSGCRGLTAVSVPDGLISIGNWAFSDCNNLNTIIYQGDIAGWCGISGLNNMMRFGTRIKTLEIDGDIVAGDIIIPASVTEIPNCAFSGCSDITTVSFMEGCEISSIGYDAFSCCTGLSEITLPDGMVSIGGSAFEKCSSITTIIIPDGVTSIGSMAFGDCSGLNSITIPDTLKEIGSSAFQGCNSLDVYYTGNISEWCEISGLISLRMKNFYLDDVLVEELCIPDGVINIPIGAFYDCTSIKTIKIASSVISLAVACFESCRNLTTVIIEPNSSLEEIGSYAFWGCSKLTTIFYGGTAIGWNNIVVGNNNDNILNATCYYYCEEEPDEEGNWWHYANGEPTIWE